MTAGRKADCVNGQDGGLGGSADELAGFALSLAGSRPEAVLVSAERGWGLDTLLARVEEALGRTAASRPPVAAPGDAWASQHAAPSPRPG